MLSALNRRLRDGPLVSIEWLFALGVSCAFVYFVVKGTWLGAAAVLGLTAGIVVILVRPDALTMIWLLGMPTLFVLGNNALINVPFLTLDRGLFLAAFGLLVARGLVQPQSLQPTGAVERAMALFLLVLVVSWATTFPGKHAGDIWGDTASLFDGYLMPFAAFLLARNMTWTRAGMTRFVWWLVVWVGGYLILVGLLQYFFGWTLFENKRYPSIHLERMTGSFGNALSYGMVLATLMVMAIWLFLQNRAPWWRCLLLAEMAGLALCIALSQGRAVWLAVPIALGYIFLTCKRVRPLLLTLGLLIGLAAPPAIFLTSGQDTLGERLGESSPIFNRVALAATALKMSAERPLFGFGFGENTFYDNKSRYYSSWGEVPAQYAADPGLPHNDFLNVLVMMGGLGLVLFIAVFWCSWRMLDRFRRQRDGTGAFLAELAVFVQGVFIIIIINAQFMDITEASYFVLVLFYFLMGMVARGPAAVEREGVARPRRANVRPSPPSPSSG